MFSKELRDGFRTKAAAIKERDNMNGIGKKPFYLRRINPMTRKPTNCRRIGFYSELNAIDWVHNMRASVEAPWVETYQLEDINGNFLRYLP